MAKLHTRHAYRRSGDRRHRFDVAYKLRGLGFQVHGWSRNSNNSKAFHATQVKTAFSKYYRNASRSLWFYRSPRRPAGSSTSIGGLT